LITNTTYTLTNITTITESPFKELTKVHNPIASIINAYSASYVIVFLVIGVVLVCASLILRKVSQRRGP